MMQPTDVIKLAYQSEFGPGHMISDVKRAEEMIERESASVEKSTVPLFTEIGDGFVRFDLSSKGADRISSSLLARIFAASASNTVGTMDRFLEKINLIRRLTMENAFAFTSAEFDVYLAEYASAGYPAVSHSQQYKDAYKPSYRVIRACYGEILPLLTAIEDLVNDSEKNCVRVAIDGHAAAGKTTLADLIASVFDCNLFHMDDFFLPPSLRTRVRMNEIGGNVHYERFAEEVLAPLTSSKEFSYGVFDCSVMDITERRTVSPKKLNIIEGSYSQHPYFGSAYNLRIFMDISPERQIGRILKRNGVAMAERFNREWIPMENKYFKQYRIKEGSHFVLKQG